MPISTTKSAKSSAPDAAGFQPKRPDLELPDWSGCDREAPPMTLTEMHRLSEQLLRSGKKRPSAHGDDDAPCAAEFSL
jgi:hypothetical protein